MKTKQILPLLILLIYFCSCKEEQNPVSVEDEQVQLTVDENAILSELNKYVTPCNTTLPNSDVSELKVLDAFANAKVLGLGEATHGTKEFFQMKHRIFKYFVENHGFKIFGFEADMGECIYIDRFIADNIGTINDAMSKMHFWTWKTQEVKELILWMNQYNMGKSETDKIHLLGVDCQYKNYNKPLILEYLDRYDPGYPEFVKTILNEIDKTTNTTLQTMLASDRDKLKVRCDSVSNYFINNSSRLIALSGKFEYDLIERLVTQTKQFIDVISTSTYNYRDEYMAENTVWLTGLLGNNSKVVQWAHNGHVAKDPSFSGSGSQGYHIKTAIGDSYKVIGFSFNQGSFRAVNYDNIQKSYTGLITHTINRLPPRESSNFIFYYAKPENFILVNAVTNPSVLLTNWLNTQRKFISIGAVYSTELYNNYYYDYNLFTYFDAIIHFHSTTAAVAYY